MFLCPLKVFDGVRLILDFLQQPTLYWDQVPVSSFFLYFYSSLLKFVLRSSTCLIILPLSKAKEIRVLFLSNSLQHDCFRVLVQACVQIWHRMRPASRPRVHYTVHLIRLASTIMPTHMTPGPVRPVSTCLMGKAYTRLKSAYAAAAAVWQMDTCTGDNRDPSAWAARSSSQAKL